MIERPTRQPLEKVNHGPNATSRSLALDAWWVTKGIQRRWNDNAARFHRLCAFLGWTEYELCSLVGVPHTTFTSWKSQTQYRFTKSECILLSFIELQCYGRGSPHVMQQIMPISGAGKSIQELFREGLSND